MQSILKVDISTRLVVYKNAISPPTSPKGYPLEKWEGGGAFSPYQLPREMPSEQGWCHLSSVNLKKWVIVLTRNLPGFGIVIVWKIPAFWLGAVSDLGWHVSIVIMISRAEVPRSHERFGSKHILKCFFESLVIYVFYSKMIKVVTLGLTVIWRNLGDSMSLSATSSPFFVSLKLSLSAKGIHCGKAGGMRSKHTPSRKKSNLDEDR